MATLCKEASIAPANLLNGFQAANPDRSWFALWTKPRQEKAVARGLHCQDVPFFLPLMPKTSLAGGRKRHSYVPFFTSYVFLFGTEKERLIALKTNRLLQIIEDNKSCPLAADLQKIELLIGSGEPLTLESRIATGQWVRVTMGHLKGLEGVVVERRKKVKLLVSVDLLNQGASLELDDFMVEPIDVDDELRQFRPAHRSPGPAGLTSRRPLL